MNVDQAATSWLSKLPPMAAIGRPYSPSLIPQKLPKNGWKRASYQHKYLKSLVLHRDFEPLFSP
jgi:hypothetical protein